jgi:hypothetical protein
MNPPIASPVMSFGSAKNICATSDSTTNNATSAAKNARTMPTPPSLGIARAWTRRSSGVSSTPVRIARRRTSGVMMTATSIDPAKTNTALNMVDSA